MLAPGTLCRSKTAILKTLSEDDSHLCRIVDVLPTSRWKNPQIPEYKVELLAMPVTAFRTEQELVPA